MLCLVLPHIITICDGKADGSFTLRKDFSHALCAKIFHMQLFQVHHYMSLTHAHSDIINLVYYSQFLASGWNSGHVCNDLKHTPPTPVRQPCKTHKVSAFTLLYLPTILQSRSIVVRHVLMAHTCSFMYINQITHPSLFTSWGALLSSRLPSCKQWISPDFQGMVRSEPAILSLASEHLNHSAYSLSKLCCHIWKQLSILSLWIILLGGTYHGLRHHRHLQWVCHLLVYLSHLFLLFLLFHLFHLSPTNVNTKKEYSQNQKTKTHLY